MKYAGTQWNRTARVRCTSVDVVIEPPGYQTPASIGNSLFTLSPSSSTFFHGDLRDSQQVTLNTGTFSGRFSAPPQRRRISYGIVIRPLMAMSTGMISDGLSPFMSIVRMTPFAAPAITPIGPLRLSTQPGIGSDQVGVTVGNLTKSLIIHESVITGT